MNNNQEGNSINLNRQNQVEEKANPFKIEVNSATIPSEKHPDRNEDAYFSDPNSGSFGVFDGVGGGPSGDVASLKASDFFRKELEKYSFSESPTDFSPEDLKNLLSRIFTEAKDLDWSSPDASGDDSMFTTASVMQLCIDKNGNRKAVIGNMGDSRVYILRARESEVEQITLDDGGIQHTLRTQGKSEEEIRQLQNKFSNVTKRDYLTEEEFTLWQQRNRLTNCLGSLNGQPNFYTVDLQEGDMLVLSTDGLNNITDKEISDILRSNASSRAKAQILVDASCRVSKQNRFRSHQDDITAIVISVK